MEKLAILKKSYLKYTERQKSCTTKNILSYVNWNYAYIKFRFQARKQETQQSVKRAKRKGEHGVKTESTNAFTRKYL